MVFKKDLTPFAKGGQVVKHRGKGSSERKPDVMAQLTNRYPKAAPVAPVAPAATTMPPFGMPPEKV
jgi:hypothetical protein